METKFSKLLEIILDSRGESEILMCASEFVDKMVLLNEMMAYILVYGDNTGKIGNAMELIEDKFAVGYISPQLDFAKECLGNRYTDDVGKIFNRAIKKGLIKYMQGEYDPNKRMFVGEKKYEWTESKSLLGYLCGKLFYDPLRSAIPEKELEKLFGIKDLRKNRQQAASNLGKKPVNAKLVDDLFQDDMWR